MVKKQSKNLTLKEKFTKEFLVESFKTAWSGKEKLNNIFLWWGGIAYVIYYFILRPIINLNIRTGTFLDTRYGLEFFVDYVLSLSIVFYLIFHIILIFKNRPKSPKLTKKQKEELKAQEKSQIRKRVLRKLLLQEPITKFRPWLVFIAIDLIIITHYSSRVF